MFSNYLKIAIRNSRKNLSFSIINFSGLIIGITTFLIISTYVSYEKSYDKYHDNAENIFRIRNDRIYKDTHDKSAGCPPGVGPTMKRLFPEVVDYARVYHASGSTVSFDPNQINSEAPVSAELVLFKQDNMYYAEQSFLDLFSYPIIHGNIRNSLVEPNTAVISISAAQKYFGDSDPIGKTLVIKNGYGNQSVVITSVFADSPSNSHLKFEILISYPTLVNKREEAGNDNYFEWNAFNTYVMLVSGSDLEKLQSKMTQLVQPNENGTEGYKRVYSLQSVTDIHLYSDLRWEPEKNGNATTVIFFSIIGILIICIAWTNYINITTARSLNRAKEVGLRKVFGSQKNELIKQFLIESFSQNFLAVIISLVILQLILPLASKLLNTSLSIYYLQPYFGIIIAMLLVGSILSGIYPALVLSSYNPIATLKGNYNNSMRGIRLRRTLVIFQFVISLVLISGTLIVYDQLSFMFNKNLGINIDRILIVQTPERSNKFYYLREKVLEIPSVLKSSLSAKIPSKQYSNTASQIRAYNSKPEDGTRCQFLDIDEMYFDLYEVPIVAGTNFNSSHKWNESIIINEEAVKVFGFESHEKAIGEKIILGGFGGQIVTVVGVAKNYHHQSLDTEILPVIFNPLEWINYISLKIDDNNIGETISRVESLWKEVFPTEPFQYYFLDELFNSQYKSNENFGQLFAIFSVLAIFISCLGLFGLISHNTERRSKEIGIRKVIGATIPNILILTGKDFARNLIISIIIAIPISYMIMSNWLDGFAYRTAITIVPFLSSSLVVILISFLTISWQSIKAATANPVDSLRNE